MVSLPYLWYQCVGRSDCQILGLSIGLDPPPEQALIQFNQPATRLVMKPMPYHSIVFLLSPALLLMQCSSKETTHQADYKVVPVANTDTMKMEGLETATIGNGCFWCTEAIFDELNGVHSVKSGYSGGHLQNPTYKEVCYGNTGHAEVIQLQFDPTVISYEDILRVFFSTHDPTTLNRQGNDVGTQYRSAVFYHSEAQKASAEKIRQEAQAWWDDPIVTEITPINRFYPAEDYHQEYFKLNGSQPYCRIIIEPKVAKFRKQFAEKLKKQ